MIGLFQQQHNTVYFINYANYAAVGQRRDIFQLAFLDPYSLFSA